MNIYKLKNDPKWHLQCWKNFSYNITDCGKELSEYTLLEQSWTGQKGSGRNIDPSINDVCPICFEFMPGIKK